MANLLRTKTITYSVALTIFMLLTIANVSFAGTVTLPVSFDSYTAWVDPNTNNGDSSILIMGTENGSECCKYFFTYIKFDFSSLPENSVIYDAEIHLKPFQNTGCFEFQVSRVTQSWSESNIKYNYSPNTSGNYITGENSCYPGAEYDLDVTSLVQYERDNDLYHYGYMIKGDNVSAGNSALVYSQESSYPPTLVVDYLIEAPSNVSASDGTYSDKVRITWDDAATEDEYKIYRNTDGSDSYSPIGTVGQNITSFDDSLSCGGGTTYYYMVNSNMGDEVSARSNQDSGFTGSCPVNGQCGSSDGQILTQVPTTNLCITGGGVISVTTNTSSYTWSCSGINGGTSDSCSATRAYTVTPSAGSGGSINPNTQQTVAYNQTKQFTVTPDSGYTVAVSGCSGSLSGSTYTIGAIIGNCTVSATFTASSVNGQCGSSDGQTLTSAPSGAGLCSTGSASGVTTNTGSYTWSCSGSNGGTNDSCSATRAYTVTPSAGSGGSISPDTSQSVAYNQTTQFTITPDSGYVATVEGTCGGSPSSGTSPFTYTTNAITGNCTVSATFTQAPDIAVTPTTIPFGNVNINSNSDKTVTVTNDGTLSLNIETVTDPSSPFSKVSDNCSDTSLTPSASCTITIRFSPTTLDDFNSTFNIPSDDPDENPVTVALTGTGGWFGTPDIDVSDLSPSFLNIVPGVNAEQTVTVTNLGDGYLNITSITSPSAPFSIVSGEDNCSGTSVTPNESCTVKIRFNSATSGAFDSSLSISSDDPDENLVDVGLLGSSTPVDNDHPTNLSPVSPANGATNMPTTVTFKWTKSSDSDGVTYKLYCDTDPSFTGTSPVLLTSVENKGIMYAGVGNGIGLMLFGIISFGTIRERKKMWIWGLMLIVTIALLISCGSGGGSSGGGSPSPGASNDVTSTVSGLSSGTTYYWKVVADDGNGGLTESGTQSFTTQ